VSFRFSNSFLFYFLFSSQLSILDQQVGPAVAGKPHSDFENFNMYQNKQLDPTDKSPPELAIFKTAFSLGLQVSF